MRFDWRVPPGNGGSSGRREFVVVPARGSVLPHGRQTLTVEFVPETVQHYSGASLTLDVPGVGEALCQASAGCSLFAVQHTRQE